MNRAYKRPDLIIMSDPHIREDTPICYIGDYWKEQWDSWDFIFDLQMKHECPVICAGDLFDHWKPSPMLLSETLIHLPEKFHTIYGQHDLPQHNMGLAFKSGIYTLLQADKLAVLTLFTEGNKKFSIEGCSWDQMPMGKDKDYIGQRNILVWHVHNYQGKQPWPDCPSPTAISLLKKYPQYDLIITGDNHKPFVEEYQGRLLVNPGSLMRMDADQIDHKPRVYLWYAETNTVEPVYIPIEDHVISREHLEVKKERDNRIDAFVSQLNGNWTATMSFEDNLEKFEKKNKTEKSIMNIVWKSLEPIK